ncbi:cyclin ccl1 [Xylariaceae sp. FL1019]|nr:cyclin ccl1 [Xylariaceae sp. FL1019]
MATEDVRYRQSSQYRLWSYSPAKLRSLRQETNATAKANISKRLLASDKKLAAMGDEEKKAALPDFLTPDDELMLLNFFTFELLRAAAFCGLPADVQATAAIFLRRFYLTNSLMTYPPMALVKTCIFFACKAESHYMRLQKFADKFPNTTGEEVLAAEYILCQGIRFAFDVRHPYRSLEGALMELKALGACDDSRLNKAQTKARDILKFSPLMTDVYFYYTPSQIMLAALFMADEGLAHRILRDAFAGQSEDVKNQFLQLIHSCRAELQKELPERRITYWAPGAIEETMKPLKKKLRMCRDPDRVDLIALQRSRREQAVKEAKAKVSAKNGDSDIFGPRNGVIKEDEREAKRRKVAGLPGGNDPFGPPLG